MSDTRTPHALELFRAALELRDDQRTAYLDRVCGDDAALRAEVDALLRSDASPWPEFDDAGAAAALLDTLRPENDGLPHDTLLAAGRYRILGKLSEGGMGVVYRAAQNNPPREVAIKVMRGGGAGLLRRFEREIRILARLRHPGIAQIYDAGRVSALHAAQPFIAMELVRGEPITAYASRHRLDTAARLELLAAVCDAVQFAHQAGVIHRDLKPENILIEQTPQGPRPRVLDFGVAAVLDAPAGTLATEPGTVIGTVAYTAPEQVAGRAGTHSDIYSLGVVLYELLCGCLPVDVRADGLATALRRIQDEPPTPLSRRDRRFRGDVETILNKALEKDVARRYASADALATDLRRYLADEPILAQPPSAAYLLRRFARRHRVLVGAGAVAVAAVLGGLVVTSLALLRARSAEQGALALARVMAQHTLPLLNDQAGTFAEREALANEVHSAVSRLLKQAPGDPTVLSVYADSLRHLSRIELDAGRTDAALRLRREALAARESAIARSADEDLKLHAARAIDMVLVGDALNGLSDVAAAEEWYLQAEQLQEWLVEREPSVEHVELLAWSAQRLAHFVRRQGRHEETAERAARFTALVERVVAERPDDLTALDGLREAHALDAVVRLQAGDRAGSKASIERALGLGRRLLAAAPQNRIYLRGFVSNVVFALAQLGGDSVEGHDALLAEVRPVAERFHLIDPTDVTATCRLASLHVHSAGVAAEDGDADAARAHLARAAALFDSVADRCSPQERENRERYRQRAIAIEAALADVAAPHDAVEPAIAADEE